MKTNAAFATTAITNRQIRTIRERALASGDIVLADQCDRALDFTDREDMRAAARGWISQEISRGSR